MVVVVVVVLTVAELPEVLAMAQTASCWSSAFHLDSYTERSAAMSGGTGAACIVGPGMCVDPTVVVEQVSQVLSCVTW